MICKLESFELDIEAWNFAAQKHGCRKVKDPKEVEDFCSRTRGDDKVQWRRLTSMFLPKVLSITLSIPWFWLKIEKDHQNVDSEIGPRQSMLKVYVSKMTQDPKHLSQSLVEIVSLHLRRRQLFTACQHILLQAFYMGYIESSHRRWGRKFGWQISL